MSVKINYDQPQEKCLVDLFNALNARNLGFNLEVTDVTFATPTTTTMQGRDTSVVMRANGSTKIKGSTRLYYKRLDMAEAPIPENALMITLGSYHNSTQSLVPNINSILGIQMKETDIVNEEIIVKQMPYGLTEKTLVVDNSSLIFKGQFKVKLIREEPLSLSRTPVIFSPIVVNYQNTENYRNIDTWKATWKNSKTIGSENDTLRPTTAFLPDRYDVEGTTNTNTDEVSVEDPLYFWYQLYPNDAPRGN